MEGLYRCILYTTGAVSCILLVMGYSLPWSVYQNDKVYVSIDLYSLNRCNTTCIRSTDLPHSCRNMEMLYIFGAFILIAVSMVGSFGLLVGAWKECSWKVLLLVLMSIIFLIGSYTSIQSCGSDWRVILQPTNIYYSLVIWTCFLLGGVGLYTGYLGFRYVQCRKNIYNEEEVGSV